MENEDITPEEEALGEAGVPFERALEIWGDPEIKAKLQAMREAGEQLDLEDVDGIPQRRTKFGHAMFERHKKLIQSVVDQLKRGKLRATGYDTSLGLQKGRIPIPADLWPSLKINFQESKAKHGETWITAIRVIGPSQHEKRLQHRAQHPVARTIVQEWYMDRVDELSKAERTSSGREDWEAAKEEFGKGVTRDLVLQLRRDHAPDEWKKRGRKKAKRNSAES